MADPKKKNDLNIDIGELIKNVRGKLEPALVESTLAELKSNLSWKLAGAIGEEINVFFDEQIKPEIQKNLISHKQAILDGIQGSMKNLGTELGKRIEKKTIDAVTEMDSWKIKKILEEIF